MLSRYKFWGTLRWMGNILLPQGHYSLLKIGQRNECLFSRPIMGVTATVRLIFTCKSNNSADSANNYLTNLEFFRALYSFKTDVPVSRPLRIYFLATGLALALPRYIRSFIFDFFCSGVHCVLIIWRLCKEIESVFIFHHYHFITLFVSLIPLACSYLMYFYVGFFNFFCA